MPYPQALGLADLRAPLLAEWREALGTIMAGYYIDGRWKREGHRFCCSPEPSEWLCNAMHMHAAACWLTAG